MTSIARIHASDKGGNASVATVTVLRAANATTQHVDTVNHIPATTNGFYATMGTPHSFTDPVSGETITEISEATAVDFQGHIDTGNIIIDAIAPGYTDLGSKVGDIVIIRPTTQYADNLADTMAMAHNDDGSLKATTAGVLINGKIVPSVASNNLTVALKTLAGNDPSASDPVSVRIGDSIFEITAALSVTLAAGTNWFGKGSSPFATNATTFNVYLGYNATDGIVLGVASLHTAIKYSDFSTTNTDYTYAKISNVAHAASSDVYENVGRFNAILGASSSYNWSLPSGNFSLAIPNRSILQYPVWFSYQRAAALTLTSTGGIAIMDSKVFDFGNNYNTSTGVFTAPVTGLYQFNGALTWGNVTSGQYAWAGLFKNGAEFVRSNRTQGVGGEWQAQVAKALVLIAGDTVGLSYASQGTQAAEVANAYQNYFEGYLVRPL